MKISKYKLDLALARSCLSVTDLRDEVSSATLARIRNDNNYQINPKTAGRLAKRLDVDVAEIIQQEA